MRRSRIRPQSAKRRKVNRIRRDMAADLGNARCGIPTPVCTGRAEHWHELVGAGQGGSRVDRRNIVPCADVCNVWVEDNPTLAYRYGWKVRRTDAMPGEGGLIPKASALWGGPDWTADAEGEALPPLGGDAA